MAKRTLPLLVVALVVLATGWYFSARDVTSSRVLTGTVVDWQRDRSVSVARNSNDLVGITFALRNAVYDEEFGPIRRGVRVTVWYRNMGEARLVAYKVRVLKTTDQ
jgi:hypothetical protein